MGTNQTKGDSGYEAVVLKVLSTEMDAKGAQLQGPF